MNFAKWGCVLPVWFAICGACGPGLIDDSVSTDMAVPSFPESSSDPLVLHDITPDTDSVNTEEICPGEITSKCEDNVHLFTPPKHQLIATEWLDSPARFTHFVKDVILGHFDDAANSPFAIQLDFEDLPYLLAFNDVPPLLESIMTLPDNDSPDNQWIGVVSHSSPIFDSSCFYVGILRQGDTYLPVGIPQGEDDEPLVRTDWPALETTATLTGAVYLASKTGRSDASLNAMCLFGDGLFCFDGDSWTTELHPGDTPEIVAVAVSMIGGEAIVHAVCENGTLFTQIDNRWYTYVMTDAPELASASVNEESGLLTVGGIGVLARGDARYMMAACAPPINIMDFRYFRESPEFVALDENGDLYSGEFDATASPSICGPLYSLEDARALLSVGPNLYVLTESGLFATTDQLHIAVE